MAIIAKIISFCFVWQTLGLTCDYPQWPSPAYWNGTFSFPAKNISGNITFCYDGENLKYSKHFSNEDSSWALTFYNNTEYFICYGPGICDVTHEPQTCDVISIPQFPFPMNQFENYTFVGDFNLVTYTTENNKELNSNSSSSSMALWVGNNIGYGLGYFGTNQYFDSKNSKIIKGNVYINEPGWVTEIRWFDYIWYKNNPSCFDLPSYCNTKPSTFE